MVSEERAQPFSLLMEFHAPGVSSPGSFPMSARVVITGGFHPNKYKSAL